MLIEYKECFNLYDRDNDGLISIEQMRQVIRSLGQCPSERELKEVQEKLGEFHFLQSMIFYYLLFSLTLVLNNWTSFDFYIILLVAFFFSTYIYIAGLR